ncbi:inner membrane protein YiaA [Paraglaciecola polaris]|uniref:Inner membrane protein yiaA n=1 Tax=Paraglaciecola polaris LMG 21857 TaxID=1129793 RepID=K6ZUN4_9ALTE|nr:inner membrane protein YiaA [Paraglaciecola polaris]GAC33992.1 inner membrane protein yiaA [Paraglaciecola polaris LMG 21857]
MTIQAPTKSYTLASVAALVIGTVAYGIGLVNAEMPLNEKGYYLIIMLYGLFSMVSLQKTIRDKAEGIKTSSIYQTLSWASSGFAIALLAVGLYNAELALSEKGFYAMAYVLSLFAAVTVQKNVRDKDALATADKDQAEFITE